MVDFLTTRQRQELLHVDRKTIYRMADDGRVAAVKVGSQWRFPRRSIEGWLKTQTPDGQIFGVGSYQTAFWTEIQVVAASVTPTFGITSVTYEIERDPVSGCPTNVFFTFRANVTFSGPMENVHLQFQHSDGARSSKFKLEITGASTHTFTDKWSFYRTASQGPKWVRLTQVFPEYREFDQINFSYECN